MTAGQNSYNCQEDSCNNPAADNYLCIPNIYSLCQEEAANMDGRDEKGRFIKGISSPWKGVTGRYSEDTLRKMSDVKKGKYVGDNNHFFGKKHTEETRLKMSKNHADMRGENNPYYGKCHTLETRVKMSHPHIGDWSFRQTKRYKEKISELNKGDKNPMYGRCGELAGNWRGGIAFEPYCPKFNKQLKEKIRERDNHTCQLCLCTEEENEQKLSVHHIHYDKPNCNPDLISLCNSCNCKVNFNRDYYESLFMEKLRSRGVV